jgi:hypothetical protein
MSLIEYWPCDNRVCQDLSLTQAEVSDALMLDWLPTFPFPTSRNFLGWPYYLLQEENQASRYLVLEPIAGLSDKQWKGFLSWMLGIAGTRKVLKDEGYIYVAPASAFYPERRQPVAIPFWHPDYPPSVLEITKDPENGCQLRPDYIAARPMSRGFTQFALVESKGTFHALYSKHGCPSSWRRQVRNAIVTVNKLPCPIQRHIVVATRCNPNARRSRTRRLQVRAWNSQIQQREDNWDALREVVSAHYSGLCRNLGLQKNFDALQIAAVLRYAKSGDLVRKLSETTVGADQELKEIGGWGREGKKDCDFRIEIELGSFHVKLSEHAVSILKALRSDIPTKEVSETINAETIGLTDWFQRESHQYEDKETVAIDRSGILVKIDEIRFPRIPQAL